MLDQSQVIIKAISNKATDGSVDIIRLASNLGINVYADEKMDESFNAEISYLKDSESFEIVVNANHSINRQRFSIAHEIAHFVLHEDKIIKLGRLSRENSGDEIEKEADKYAEEILMPKEMVLNILKDTSKKIKLSLSQINKIAKEFKVSIIVAKIRLQNLNYNVPYISESYSS